MPARFDVFLSHASSDKPRVEELARRLTREGLRPWLDKWNLIPGTAWQPEIEAVLADCGTCAVIIGAGGFGPWHHEEMRTAINRRVEDREHAFRVIPVLLPDVERPERNRLPGFLTATTWVEFRDSLDDPAAFHRLLCGIRGIEPGDGAGGAAFEGKNPYRGLELFDIEHAPLFFGREALTEWLLDALKRKPSAVENRFLAIVGASGSGKSSLARAGLLAALKDGKLDGSAAWPRAICRPGAEPFFNLAKALTGLAAESVSAAVFDRLQGRKDGERSLHVGAGLVLGEPPRAERLVVLVDQFEEIFTLCNDEPERRDFIANLLHAATVASGRTIVVLTMRADFYPRCAAYADLAAALSSNHQVLVGPMTEDELRRAIDRPARLAGLEPEAGLVELLVDDIRGRAGALPLLQFALQEIWRRRDDYRLTIRTYREIGQIEGALQRKADAVYGNFTDEQKELCRRVFLRLIQPGEGSEDTRRRASLRELLPDDPTQAGAVQAIIDRLSDPESRLLTTERQQTASGERTLEVTHEALIRGWPQLRKWIETDRAGLRTQLRLTDAAKEWADAIPEAKEGALYAGARLAVASEWAASHRDDLSALELAFLSASQERERQIKADEAEKSRRLAEAEHARAEEAEARKRDAEVAVRRQKKLSQGILVAAALSLLLAGAAVWESTRAARATRTANTAAETAKKSAKLAEDKEAIAIAEKKNADIARKLADAQRDRALARQLAAKSLMRWSQPGCVGRELEKTILVAVESLRLYPTPEANQVVRRGLDLLPRLITRYEVPNVQSLGMVGREGVLAAGWNGANFFEKNTKGRLWALDVLSGRRQEFEVASIRRGSLTIIASSLKTGHASVNSTTSVSAVAISHDGRRLAGAVIDGGINIWDAWGQTLLSNIPYKGSSAVKVALDREGRRVAIADVGQIVSEKGNGFSDAEGRGGLIQVWEVEGGKEVFRKDMLDVATSVALSGDGTRVAAGSASGIIHIWDLGTGELIGSYRHSSYETGMNMFPGIEELALDQGGRVLAAMGQDEGIRIWRIDSDREIVRAYHLAGNSLALNREGSVLASADNNRAAVIQLWDLTPWPRLEGHEGAISGKGFAFHEESFRTANYRSGEFKVGKDGKGEYVTDGELKVIDHGEHGKEIGSIRYGRGSLLPLDLSADGKVLATADGQTVIVRDAETLAERMRVRTPEQPYCVALSGDGRRLAIGMSNQFEVPIYDVPSGATIARVRPGVKTTWAKVAFNGDGSLLGAVFDQGQALLYRVPSGELLARISPGGVYELGLSEDGSWVATGRYNSPTSDGVVQVWSVPDGLEVFRENTAGYQTCFRFLNGGRLAALTISQGYHMWTWRHENLIAETARRIPKGLNSQEYETLIGPGGVSPLSPATFGGN